MAGDRMQRESFIGFWLMAAIAVTSASAQEVKPAVVNLWAGVAARISLRLDSGHRPESRHATD
jgi:hypothetical protein